VEEEVEHDQEEELVVLVDLSTNVHLFQFVEQQVIQLQ
jgi:hypothetical protein